MSEPLATELNTTPDEALTQDASDKSHTSRGERIFNWITYGGVAGIGTFLLTLRIAYNQKYKPQSRFYHGLKNGLNQLGVPQKWAGEMVETTNLMHGGNFMMIPVMVLEHFKKPLVRAFSGLVNEKPDENVKEAPKQSLGSLIKGRLTAWGIVFAAIAGASHFFGKYFEKFQHKVGAAFAGFSEVPTHELRGITRKAFNALPAEAKLRFETKPYSYGKLTALDLFATAAAATLLYVGSRFFAKRAEKRQEMKIERQYGAHGADMADAVPSDAPETASKPTATVQQVQRQAAIANAPELQVSAS